MESRMLREMVAKVVRRTPGLRRVRDLVRGSPNSSEPSSEPSSGATKPDLTQTPDPGHFGATSPKASPLPAAAPTPKKAPIQAKKTEAEIDALRAEAEKTKAKIRARKERQAAESTPAVTGIAAMIAQSGGVMDDIDAGSNVRATSGVDFKPQNTEIHQAGDGGTYWGAIDNESSRAFAQGDILIVDQWECINCGTCVENTEHVFALPDDAKAVVVSQEGPMDLIQDAIDACPVTCIHWTDEPGQFEQVNDAQGASLS